MTAYSRPLPSRADVRAAVDALTQETGRTPSVLALATRLGLANTTFRRNFPDVCTDLTPTAHAPASANGAVAYTEMKADNARLRRDKRDLAAQLEAAVAAIQRLSVDNDRLRAALHEARAVTPLPRRRESP
ncbi:hypothetical protein [Streptomyces fragilis]|uniref:TetR family transcriptional regulator n=1 Tax=Streptomyces fragilis TaxID=67301 RepID=A0ABV2YRB7_9ACTN|nr:hypothetical protein [Streptomyces fragilis]